MERKTLLLTVFLSLILGCSCFNIFQYPADFLEEDGADEYEEYSWLEQAKPVFENGIVQPAWSKEGNLDTLIEDKWTSVSVFIVEIDSYVGEQFGPPEYSIVDAPINEGEDEARGRSDDILSIVASGDAIFGNFEEEDEVFFFRMNFYCLKPGKRQISVTFTVIDSNTQVSNVTFFWWKTCASGVREGFDIILQENTNDDVVVVENGVTRPHWKFDAPEHKLGHDSWETIFLLSIDESFGSQSYAAPVVTTSDPSVLRVRAVGEASSANIIAELDPYQELRIIHTCESTKGEALVSVNIHLGSFDDIKFSWIKSCEGGKIASGFQVSSELSGEPNVVLDSVTREQWDPTSPKIKVPHTETSTSFFMKNTQTGRIRFSKPSVSIKPAHVVKAIIGGDDDIYSGGYLDSDPVELRVDYKCTQKGNATVTVTIPFTEHLHPIEFSWIKECPKFTKPTKKNAYPGYMTANRAMLLFCFVVTVVTGLGGYSFVQYKKRKAQERRAALDRSRQTYD